MLGNFDAAERKRATALAAALALERVLTVCSARNFPSCLKPEVVKIMSIVNAGTC